MIREGHESDLPAIVGIYNASIPGRLATADTEPVSVESRRSWFRDRDVARHPLDLERHANAAVYLSLASLIRSAIFWAIGCASVPVDPAPCE